jgi:hypothetical protein
VISVVLQCQPPDGEHPDLCQRDGHPNAGSVKNDRGMGVEHHEQGPGPAEIRGLAPEIVFFFLLGIEEISQSA